MNVLIHAMIRAVNLLTAIIALAPWGYVFVMAGILCAVYLSRHAVRTLATKVLSHFGERHAYPRSVYRDIGKYVPEFPPAAPNHPHGWAATERAQARSGIVQWANHNGFELYHYQKAKNQNGSRHEYFFQHDLDQPYEGYSPGNGQHVVISDTDHYLEESELSAVLFSSRLPVILSTIFPTAPLGSRPGVAWTVHEDGSYEQRNGGGSVYRHRLWNFETDIVTMVDYDWVSVPSWARWVKWLFWFLAPVRVCYVEGSRLGDMHRAVTLVPMVDYGPLTGWLMLFFVEHTRLHRVSLVKEGLLDVCGFDDDEPTGWLGVPGNHSIIKLPMEVYESFKLYCQDAVTPPTASSIGHWFSMLTPNPIEMSKHDAQILARVSRLLRERLILPDWITIRPRVRVLSYDMPEEGESTKLEPFASPLLDEAFTFINNPSAMRGALRTRMVDLVNLEPLKPEAEGYISEFVQEFSAQCFPVSLDDIVKAQNKSSQRKVIEAYGMDDYFGPVSSFVKAECYAAPKDARIITQISPGAKILSAQFVYGMKPVFDSFPFYGFGKSPKGVATKVMSIASSSSSVMNTDFSRWDGRVGEAIRVLEASFLLACYPNENIKVLADVLREDMAKKGFARVKTQGGDREFLVWYYTLYARLSGSMATSMFNSLSNAFVCYYGRRLSGDTHADAVHYLRTKFVCGGDDGLCGDPEPTGYKLACDRLGLKTTIEIVPRGAWGVSFLSRFYTPAVWTGAVDSYCDLRRQLSKFHVGPKNVDLDAMIFARAVMIARSDSATPILGEIGEIFSQYLLKCYKPWEKMLENHKLFARAAPAMSWWTLSNSANAKDWPQGNVALEFAYEYRDRVFGDDIDLRGFNNWYDYIHEKLDHYPEIKPGSAAHSNVRRSLLETLPLLATPSPSSPVGSTGVVEITGEGEHYNSISEPKSDFRKPKGFKNAAARVKNKASRVAKTQIAKDKEEA